MHICTNGIISRKFSYCILLNSKNKKCPIKFYIVSNSLYPRLYCLICLLSRSSHVSAFPTDFRSTSHHANSFSFQRTRLYHPHFHARLGSSTNTAQALVFGAFSGNRQFLTFSLQRPYRPIKAKYLKFKTWSKIVNHHCLKIHTLILKILNFFLFFTNQDRFSHTAAVVLGPGAILLIYVKFP